MNLDIQNYGGYKWYIKLLYNGNSFSKAIVLSLLLQIWGCTTEQSSMVVLDNVPSFFKSYQKIPISVLLKKY